MIDGFMRFMHVPHCRFSKEPEDFHGISFQCMGMNDGNGTVPNPAVVLSASGGNTA